MFLIYALCLWSIIIVNCIESPKLRLAFDSSTRSVDDADTNQVDSNGVTVDTTMNRCVEYSDVVEFDMRGEEFIDSALIRLIAVGDGLVSGFAPDIVLDIERVTRISVAVLSRSSCYDRTLLSLRLTPGKYYGFSSDSLHNYLAIEHDSVFKFAIAHDSSITIKEHVLAK